MTFQPAEGELLADKYRLKRRIGKGGMGQVWTATDVQLDRVVAIKFIDPALMQHERVRTRFEREARTSARLQSRHIVRIYDHGVVDEAPFFVMEHLEGEDLADRLMREGRLPLPAAALLLRYAAKGVQHAHDSGVVHRDLKPRNLFVALDDGEEVVKILDFGVAKAEWAKGGDTKTGDIVGSPHYMSPEQVHGAQRVDHRADLWSLAVILFRIVTGKRPFRGEGIGEVIVKICTEDPLRATELVPDLPAQIDGFFTRALARKPAERFQSAREMSEAFDEVAGVEQKAAAPSMRGLRAEVAAGGTPHSAVRTVEDEEKTIRTPPSQDAVAVPVAADTASAPAAPAASGPAPSAPSPNGPPVPAPSTPSAPEFIAPDAQPSAPSTPSLQGSSVPPEDIPSSPSFSSLGGPSYGTFASLQSSLHPSARSKRKRWVVGGVVGGLALVSMIAVVSLTGGGDESAQPSQGSEQTSAAASPSADQATDEPVPVAEPAPTADPSATTSAAQAAASTTPEDDPPTASAKPVPRPRPRPRPQPTPEPRATSRERLGY